MKILIIDTGAHEKIIHKFLTIFPNREKIIILGKEERKGMFPKDIFNSYQVELANKWKFWKTASAISKDVRQVILFTPPEYVNGILGLKELLFFIWYVHRHHPKITVLIRNTFRWENSNILSKLRKFTLRYLKDRTAFEYAVLQKSLHISHKYCVLPVSAWQDNPFCWDSNLVIGFAGSIDLERRDYSWLSEALSQLSADEKNILNFQICGLAQKTEIEILISFLDGVKVVETSLKHVDYDANTKSTHLLIAPLKKGFNYGIKKGTGAFGDALYANRKVIIPKFACSDNEFDGVALYYENAKDLVKLLKSTIDAWKRRDASFFVISPAARIQFSPEKIYDNYLKFIFS